MLTARKEYTDTTETKLKEVRESIDMSKQTLDNIAVSLKKISDYMEAQRKTDKSKMDSTGIK